MKRICAVVACIVLVAALSSCGAAEPVRNRVSIAMPEPPGSSDGSANYYRLWLEEQTGLAIELELVKPHFMEEYLRLLLTERETEIDAVFLSPGLLTAEQAAEYGARGRILALNSRIAPQSQIARIFDRFPLYDLRSAITGPDGNIYYMPNLSYSESVRNAQTLWVNARWLEAVDMKIPETTEQFREMLRAFQTGDPNGNGVRDEIPIASGVQNNQSIFHFIMNAFVYTDPDNFYFAAADSGVYFAPMTDQWRQGVLYSRTLYEEGLLDDTSFSFSPEQLARVVNAPQDLAGGFAAGAVADVLHPGTPALYSRFVYVPPLEGPAGVRCSTIHTSRPEPGGIILSSSQNPDDAFRLMDFMLCEEAYLVAAFGQQDVDWEFAGVSEIGFDGNPAAVSVKSNEWDVVADRHFGQYGPFITYPQYGDGVAWNGYQADQRYLNARAARIYRQYEPSDYLTILTLSEEDRGRAERIYRYVQNMVAKMVSGDCDPADDLMWAAYLSQLEQMGVADLADAIEAAQRP